MKNFHIHGLPQVDARCWTIRISIFPYRREAQKQQQQHIRY
jgi:hypothetical protein